MGERRFGEAPTAAQRDESALYLAGGLVCALLLPAVGMLVAARSERRGSVLAYGIALAISLGGLALVSSR